MKERPPKEQMEDMRRTIKEMEEQIDEEGGEVLYDMLNKMYENEAYMESKLKK